MEIPKEQAVSVKFTKADKYFNSYWIGQLLQQFEDIRDETYFLYHIETGLRVSDVVASEWVHVDWSNKRTYTYDHKKDAWRWIYWPDHIKAKLKRWRLYQQRTNQKTRLVFPMSEKTANRIIKRAAYKAGHPYWKLTSSHWCRHTFIRLSQAQGRSMVAVQQNTGDKLGTILKWYSMLDQEGMQREIGAGLTNVKEEY